MQHKLVALAISALVTLGVGGCSSGSGAGNPNGGINPGTSSFNCSSGCSKVMAANCPNSSYATSAECVQECEQFFQGLSSSCKNAVASFEQCFLNGSLSCSENGSLQSSAIDQCKSQAQAALPCLESSGGGSTNGDSTNGDTGGTAGTAGTAG